MVNSLRKVDFWHASGHYAWKKIRVPLRKSWVRPCLRIVLTYNNMHITVAILVEVTMIHE